MLDAKVWSKLVEATDGAVVSFAGAACLTRVQEALAEAETGLDSTVYCRMVNAEFAALFATEPPTTLQGQTEDCTERLLTAVREYQDAPEERAQALEAAAAGAQQWEQVQRDLGPAGLGGFVLVASMRLGILQQQAGQDPDRIAQVFLVAREAADHVATVLARITGSFSPSLTLADLQSRWALLQPIKQAADHWRQLPLWQVVRRAALRFDDDAGQVDLFELTTMTRFVLAGRWTLRDLMRSLALSEPIRHYYIRPRTPEQAAEWLVERLLERPIRPEEAQAYAGLLRTRGYQVVVEQVVGSDEYMQKYGIDRIPGYAGPYPVLHGAQ